VPPGGALQAGPAGSIGSAIARQFCVRAQHCCAPAWQNAARTLILLDHSEQNLYEIHSELSSAITTSSPQIVPILGDVNDAPLLDDLFEKYRPTQIFHAAAFKHVPLMEENPIAVIRNNILGTWTLAAAAQKYRARQLTMISTDKAASPRSIMGAAKRVAEIVLTRLDSPATRTRSLRLGNVLGSTGSVVPLFQRQIQNGGPVTVTHPDACRYFLSLEEATNLIFAAVALEDSGTLFVPELNAPIKILDLAQQMIRESTANARPSEKQIEIAFTGLRPGDKLTEDLLSSFETSEPTSHPKLRRILSPISAPKSLDAAIASISTHVPSRNLPALLDTIRTLVPDYHPSDLLSAQTSAHLSATAKA
jgi:FlaA1/EpsC-like NDP-sugar epimerase